MCVTQGVRLIPNGVMSAVFGREQGTARGEVTRRSTHDRSEDLLVVGSHRIEREATRRLGGGRRRVASASLGQRGVLLANSLYPLGQSATRSSREQLVTSALSRVSTRCSRGRSALGAIGGVPAARACTSRVRRTSLSGWSLPRELTRSCGSGIFRTKSHYDRIPPD